MKGKKLLLLVLIFLFGITLNSCVPKVNEEDTGVRSEERDESKVESQKSKVEYEEVVESPKNAERDIEEEKYSDKEGPIGVKRLIFIHHSTGENWLSDYDGGLGKALMEEGYFVSDTNYGWGPDGIGDSTDIGNWWTWFRSPESKKYLQALYEESEQNSEYERLEEIPTGENEIIMFKSCFPNSYLRGDAKDSIPEIDDNPLKGESSDSAYHTISNAKGIYLDLLNYFKTKQDKLFIVVTAPPLGKNNTEAEYAKNAVEFNKWLTEEWLSNYEYNNVKVFDFFGVLTNRNSSGYSEYSTDEADDHPNTQGNKKATKEFVPFLNEVYENWKQ